MRNSRFAARGLGLLALTSGMAMAAPAAADPPATANVLQIGLGFRYGLDQEDGDFNPWGLGIGADVGYTLPMAVYVGGTFEYFFGDTIQIGEYESSANIWQLMAEGGYDLGLTDSLVLRPKLGAGIASLNQEECASDGCIDTSQNKFALAPGLTLMYLGKISLSFDVRYEFIFTEPNTLNGILLAAGIGF